MFAKEKLNKMDEKDIVIFIENHYRKMFTPWERSKEYFIKGNFKNGFRVMFEEYKDCPVYLFKLDNKDLEYLVKKYTPIYDEIKEKNNKKEIQRKKELIEKLTKEIENEL